MHVSDSLHPAVECRFEYSVTNLESSLAIEKQQHEASVVELADAQSKIGELLREVGNTDEKSTLLQSTIQRFFFVPFYRLHRNPLSAINVTKF
jgi:myosin-5